MRAAALRGAERPDDRRDGSTTGGGPDPAVRGRSLALGEAPSIELLSGPPADVAMALLGMVLVRDGAAGVSSGRIVETEAYGGPEDRASHARAGRTRRTGIMFGPPGRAYVYLVYGMHHCLNVVCGPEGQASAVLIRALEPLQGEALMASRRGSREASPARLAAGPARLCQALAIDRSLDGADLRCDPRLRLIDARTGRAANQPAVSIVAGPRIGVHYAGPGWSDRPWRFGIAGHPALSRPFPTRG